MPVISTSIDGGDNAAFEFTEDGEELTILEGATLTSEAEFGPSPAGASPNSW